MKTFYHKYFFPLLQHLILIDKKIVSSEFKETVYIMKNLYITKYPESTLIIYGETLTLAY